LDVSRARDKKPYNPVARELGVSESTAILPKGCVRAKVCINRFSEVTYNTNRYSVPQRFAYRDAIIELFHDRICVFVDSVLVAEHERTFGKHKASLNLVHFIDLISFLHRGVVLAEVLRRRRFHHSMQSLLNGYVETNPASASKRFMRVVTLLEQRTMQEVVDAVEAGMQRGTNDPAAIALILKQGTRPFDPDDDSLHVFDSEYYRNDKRNLNYIN
jgi:hypothetical protein